MTLKEKEIYAMLKGVIDSYENIPNEGDKRE